MKKTVFLSLAVMTCVMMMSLAGCGKEKVGGKQVGSLKLEAGVLTWDAQKDALSYEVDMGSGGENVSKTSYLLADRCNYIGDFTVTVRAVDAAGKKTDVGAMEISAQALSKPMVQIGGSEGEPCFEWEAVEGASGYTYDAYDGKGIQTAEANEEGIFSVPVSNLQEQRITVTAHGTSEDNQLFVSQKVTRIYSTSEMFDMKLLGSYPAVFTGDADSEVYPLQVGSTLKKGLYELEVSMYLMDPNGYRLAGNGTWGRRIKDQAGTHFWFCENAVRGYEKESVGTIPAPDKPITMKMKLTVDRGGNVVLPFLDFDTGEKVVISDIKYNGKSVLNASHGRPNAVPEVKKFDTTTLDKYLVTYQAPGGFNNQKLEPYLIEIPAKLADGKHHVKVSYYICTGSGDIVDGNGGWARRLSSEIHVNHGPYVWLNEYEVAGRYPGVDIPLPTVKQTSTFTVEVKNGKFNLVAIDFGVGEMVIIDKVQTLTRDISGNGIFVSEGEPEEKFEVETTLKGKPRYGEITLSISYRVSDVFGDSLTGNGKWGRRIVTEKNEHYWLCKTAVSDAYKESENTLPKSDQVLVKDFFVYEVNKFGMITLDLFDFQPGEMIEILSIKYEGEEVLVK